MSSLELRPEPGPGWDRHLQLRPFGGWGVTQEIGVRPATQTRAARRGIGGSHA